MYLYVCPGYEKCKYKHFDFNRVVNDGNNFVMMYTVLLVILKGGQTPVCWELDFFIGLDSFIGQVDG